MAVVPYPGADWMIYWPLFLIMVGVVISAPFWTHYGARCAREEMEREIDRRARERERRALR